MPARPSESAPTRRTVLCALASAGTLAACGRVPGGRAEAADALPPLPGPAMATPHPEMPELRLLPATDSGAIGGWVMGGAVPVPFILDPGAADDPNPPMVFLGGDRKRWSAAAMTPIWRAQARAGLAHAGLLAGTGAAGTFITLGRPFAGDPARWRSAQEVAALAHALGVLGRGIGFGRVDLLGHSSGGHLAVALAQETGRVRFLSAAAPPLDLIAWHQAPFRRVSATVRAQYDPLAHVATFRADAAVLVADLHDSVAPPRAWRGWLGRALALGKPVTLVLAQGGGPDRHGLIAPAAEALASLRTGRAGLL